MRTLVLLDIGAFIALVAALVWRCHANKIRVVNHYASRQYRTRTGVPIYCLQGGKSIAGRIHARGNWEPGDENIGG